MLTLSRKPDQAVIIRVPPSECETVITVLLTETRGDVARIAFDAPRYAAINRKEVDDKIQAELPRKETAT